MKNEDDQREKETVKGRPAVFTSRLNRYKQVQKLWRTRDFRDWLGEDSERSDGRECQPRFPSSWVPRLITSYLYTRHGHNALS